MPPHPPGSSNVRSTSPASDSFQIRPLSPAQTYPPPTTRHGTPVPSRVVEAIVFVRGSIFVTRPTSSVLDTHAAPPPNATMLAPGTPKRPRMRPVAGSTRTTRDSPWATQTDPAPVATPPGALGCARSRLGNATRATLP